MFVACLTVSGIFFFTFTVKWWTLRVERLISAPKARTFSRARRDTNKTQQRHARSIDSQYNKTKGKTNKRNKGTQSSLDRTSIKISSSSSSYTSAARSRSESSSQFTASALNKSSSSSSSSSAPPLRWCQLFNYSTVSVIGMSVSIVSMNDSILRTECARPDRCDDCRAHRAQPKCEDHKP